MLVIIEAPIGGCQEVWRFWTKVSQALDPTASGSDASSAVPTPPSPKHGNCKEE